MSIETLQEEEAYKSPSLAPTIEWGSYTIDPYQEQDDSSLGRVLSLVTVMALVVMLVFGGVWMCRREQRAHEREQEQERAQALEDKQQQKIREETIQRQLIDFQWQASRDETVSENEKDEEAQIHQAQCRKQESDASMLWDDHTQSCAICFASFQEGQTVSKASNEACKHIFCVDCISSWLLKNDACPICRRPYLDTSTEKGEAHEELASMSEDAASS